MVSSLTVSDKGYRGEGNASLHHRDASVDSIPSIGKFSHMAHSETAVWGVFHLADRI